MRGGVSHRRAGVSYATPDVQGGSNSRPQCRTMGEARREQAVALRWSGGAISGASLLWYPRIDVVARIGEIMSTALARWRRHRVDYRGPAFAALVLATLLIALLPRMWLLLDHRETREGRTWLAALPPISPKTKACNSSTRAFFPARRDWQTPANAARARPSPHPQKVALDKEPPRRGEGESDFAWDPTRGYRLSDEL